MPNKRAFCLGVLFSFLLLSGCRPGSKQGFQTIRFIDLLRVENVRLSPLLDAGKAKDSPPQLMPRSAALLDWGSGENPFELKRKLDLGTLVMDILFSPPRSEYVFDIRLPADSVLEVGAGVVRDINFEKLNEALSHEPRGVQFIVELETRGRKKTVLQKFHPLPEKKDSRTLNYSFHRVELPPEEQDVRLTFLTAGEAGPFSFWYNPVIYTQGRSGRAVILVSLDTLRADHLGCYGYSRPTSPNIDSFAEDGVLFEHTYAASNWTLPAHVSLLTSLGGPSHQVYFDNERIDPSNIMLAEVLRQNRFFCTAITGGGYVSALFGFGRGFETYREGEGFPYQNSAELVAGAAAEWLKNNRDRDFFLFLHTYQTHNPYACPAPYDAMFLGEKPLWRKLDLLKHLGGQAGTYRSLPEEERQNIIGLYDGEIRYADEALIKPLVAKLKELRLYDRSMIILTSDHGEEFYEHGAWMHGPNLYDESLRVPLIIKFPGSKFRGKRMPALVRQVDIMPTILDSLGVDAGAWRLEGRSLLPVVRGREREDRTFLADSVHTTLTARSREAAGPSGGFFPDQVATGTRENKVIFNRELAGQVVQFFSPPPRRPRDVEVYDLEADPGEKTDVASRRSRQAAETVRVIQDIYKTLSPRKPNRVVLDEKIEEQLRALGYIR